MERSYKNGQELMPYKPGSWSVIERAIRRQIEVRFGAAEQASIDVGKICFRFRNDMIECIWHRKKLRLDIHPGFFRAKKDK